KLGSLSETTVLKVSHYYLTQPLGRTDQDWFLNAAVLLDTKLRPRQLLQEILRIEQEMGRVRKEKWEPRLIDLDVLFLGQEVIEEKDLQIPHPHLSQRRFVLLPLAEIAPKWVHPVLKLTPGEMLNQLSKEGQEAIRV
ncbi:MAG: 2-amino-4-hydroxy-6-hydroxymethyldihydropteridine diphosphokinase, partial [Deltaproteobacteria bacterium]|nr:2-amino-4-hydroxy-6-hydroxymethyldihydropteridine diphosphokinase [Deltaproteobacteria bacterium]